MGPISFDEAGAKALLDSPNFIMVFWGQNLRRITDGDPAYRHAGTWPQAGTHGVLLRALELLSLDRDRPHERDELEWRDGQRYVYRFKGSPSSTAGNGIDSAFRLYFIKNQNMLLIVQDDTELASTLLEFVHSGG